MTNFQRMMIYYKRYRVKLFNGCLCVLLSAVVGLAAPVFVGRAIDELQRELTREKLMTYALIVLAIALIKGFFLYLQRMILVAMSRDIENDLRNDYYKHLQRLPLSFYHQFRTGDLMARATNDLSAVRMLVGPAIMYGFNTIIVTIIALPAMIKISGTLTALVFATFPLVSVATQYFSKQIHERFEQVQEYFSDLTARAQESLSGVRVIRSYSREDYEVGKFKKLNREFVGRNIGLIRLNALFTPTLHALIGFGPALSLWYGGSLIAKGDLTVGKFVEFNLYLGLLIWPMIALGYVVSLYQRGMASMGRINVVLNTEPTIKEIAEKVSVKGIQGRIEFKGLNFKYKDKLVLKNIDLKIEPGQTVAIVGRTGSGKTTLLNLIPRLYEAPHGQVLIDGRPIEEIPLSLLRQSIGYVPQESFLFSNTLAGNIAFGVEEGDPKEIAIAAERAGLSTDITDFPKGFETVVGERGITLSGGQKQRVSIARALIRQPKILILDDSLSAVDTETEEKILNHLREVMTERTSLIVSHRISTVKNADLIIVLAEGEIVEQGTHQQLLDKGGLYAELYEKQLLEEELAVS